MIKKRMTLGDIAKELNVSIVLPDKAKEKRIDAEMSRKVITKAMEQRYYSRLFNN